MKLVRIETTKSLLFFQVLSPSAFSAYEAGNLTKARSHKYIKREPYTTASGKKKYRYWYQVPGQGLVSQDRLKIGTSFSFGEGEEAGHFHVVRVVHNKVTMRHDETGREITTDIDTIRDILHHVAQGSLLQKPTENQPPPSSEQTVPSSASSVAEIQRDNLERVVKQSPKRLVADIEAIQRYRSRDCIQDLRHFSILQNKPKSIIGLYIEMDDDEAAAKQWFEALYGISNQGISLKVNKSSFTPETHFHDAALSIKGNFHRVSKTGSRSEAGACERILHINTSKMYVTLENLFLRLPSEMRGNSISVQIYQRQEDFLKELTSEFSDEEKKKVSITIHAALDVGKYYWMTQGFQYLSKSERELHINSLQEELTFLKDFLTKKTSILTISPETKLEEVKAAGITPEVVDLVIARLDALPKTVEPWELLELDKDLPRFTILRSSSDEKNTLRVDCGLIKFAALSGTSWYGKKMIHPEVVGGKAQDGATYAERHRAESFLQAEEKGNPWTWLHLQDGTKTSSQRREASPLGVPSSTNSLDEEAARARREQTRLTEQQRATELGLARLQADATRTTPRVTRRGRMI